MTDNKKDIIIQVEIASSIYQQIEGLKTALGKIAVPKIDTSQLSKIDWAKDMPKGATTIMLRSSFDPSFSKNFKHAKAALNSLKASASIPIKIAPIDASILSQIKAHNWDQLKPPDSIKDSIATLNSALSTLGNRLTTRRIGGKGGTTKSLAQIIQETSDAFANMAGSAAMAASAVGGIKTAGIASNPAATRGGKGKKSDFDPTTFTADEQRFYADKRQGLNDRELKNLQNQMSANARLRQSVPITGALAKNNLSGMEDMGGLKGAMSRVLLFGSATSVLYGGISAIRKAIDITIELENEMVQLQKVMSDTTPFEEMKGKLFDISETMGVSVLESTKLAKIWAQQGFEMNDTLKLVEASMVAMNALNISTAQSTDFLTSITRVWGVELDELKKVMAGVMRVQADYAIESEDLTVILTRIGSGVRAAGDSMAFLAGASTALRESTRKTASQIFTSLKTIYAKSFSTEVTKALADVGVYAKMSADQFRPFSDVLTELAGKWKTLSDSERKHLAITIGQSRYWSDFFALMENFSIAQSATLSFYRAWDDASKASELQQKSLKNTLQGVFTSFAKIGDTFGVKFFTPLVKSLAAPIKLFADVMAKLGGAHSAIVMAAGLALLGGAFKTMFGHFPAYEKFLGRNKLAGDAFTKSVIAQRTAIMGSISANTAYGGTIKFIANSLEQLTGRAGVATKTVRVLSVMLARLSAVSTMVVRGIANISVTLLSFAGWSVAFWAAGQAIDFLIDRLKSAKNATREFIESLPDDVLEKIQSIGRTDQKTGAKVSQFSDVKEALDILLPKLIEKQKELSTETKKHVITWQEFDEIVKTLDEKTIATLRKNYGSLNKPIEDHIKIWEDLQTTIAITQNLMYSGVAKRTEEFKKSISTSFTEASSGAAEMSAIFRKTTGLSEADMFDRNKVAAAFNKNITALINDPLFINAASKFSSGFGEKVDLGTALTNAKGLGFNYDSRGLNESITSAIGFSLLDAREQGAELLKKNPLDITMAEISGIDPKAFDNHMDNIRGAARKLFGGLGYLMDEADKKLNDYTKLKDYNDLQITTTGKPPVFGELFISYTNKAGKAIADLRGELEKIRLLYNVGAIDEKDILKEQQKAYKDYINSVSNDFAASKQELAEIGDERQRIIATILADPNKDQFMKDWKPGMDIGKYLIDQAELAAEQSEDTAETFNTAANAAQEAAAAGNKVFAENAKKLKSATERTEELKLEVGALGSAYSNLKYVALEPLARINALLEKQAFMQKVIKINQEYIDKTAIEYLKTKLQLEKELNDIVINSARSTADPRDYKSLELTKRKELALHKYYALKENEIDFEKNKRELPKPTELRLISNSWMGSLFTDFFNRKSDAELASLKGLSSELENVRDSNEVVIGINEQMYVLTQRIAEQYSIWDEHMKSVEERSQFIRDSLAESITDFARINETHGLSVLTDTIGKIGKRFQEEQAKIFVSSIINSKVGGFVLPSEEDIKFTERLAATRTAFFESVYGAMHQGAVELATIFNAKLPDEKIMDRYKMESEAAGFKDLKKAANISAIGNLAATMGLSFLGGNAQNKQQGSQIGSIVGMVLPKLLGANPVTASIMSVVSMFGGGLLGSLFGGKTDQKQDTMIGQLKLIEQNTARVADLTEKMVNIPGSVFLPPTGGFVIQGGLTINADGIRDPQAVADVVVGRLSQEFGLSSRRSGDRGRF